MEISEVRVKMTGGDSDRVRAFCSVTFDEEFVVRDIKVIEADPPGIFNKASIGAAKKFKYRPRVVNGEPIEVHGVRNLFRYQLER